MFGLSVFFVPIFAAVPLTATAPALIIVGAFMMGPAGAMDWDNFKESLPAFLVIAVMPLTYSIANGVVAGLLSYGVISAFTKSMGSVNLPKMGLNEPMLSGATSPIDQLRSGSVSAVTSPHAMVRDPSKLSTGSFGGLSALAGQTPSETSPQATPEQGGFSLYPKL